MEYPHYTNKSHSTSFIFPSFACFFNSFYSIVGIIFTLHIIVLSFALLYHTPKKPLIQTSKRIQVAITIAQPPKKSQQKNSIPKQATVLSTPQKTTIKKISPVAPSSPKKLSFTKVTQIPKPKSSIGDASKLTNQPLNYGNFSTSRKLKPDANASRLVEKKLRQTRTVSDFSQPTIQPKNLPSLANSFNHLDKQMPTQLPQIQTPETVMPKKMIPLEKKKTFQISSSVSSHIDFKIAFPKIQTMSKTQTKPIATNTIQEAPSQQQNLKALNDAKLAYNQIIASQIRLVSPQIFHSELVMRVRLVIGLQGELKELQELRSSGNMNFDFVARKALKNATFPPLSEALAQNPPYVVIVNISPR